MSHTLSYKPLQLVHSDVWGPSPVISNKNYRYYVNFIDDFSKFTWLFSMSTKSVVSIILHKFIPFVENLLSAR